MIPLAHAVVEFLLARPEIGVSRFGKKNMNVNYDQINQLISGLKQDCKPTRGGFCSKAGQAARGSQYAVRTGKIICLLILFSLLPLSIVRGQDADAEAKVRHLVEQLKSQSTEERWNAAYELGKMGPAAQGAIRDLVHVLNWDLDKNVRMNAAQALGRIGPAAREEALGSLIVLLNDPDPNIRWGANSALDAMGVDANGKPPEIVELLKKEKYQNDRDFRWRAMMDLGGITNERKAGVETIIDTLNNDRDKGVQASAAEALGMLEGDGNTQAAVQSLLIRLNDPDQVIRRTAITALGKIKARDEVDPLIRMLDDSNDPDIRWRAELALGKIGPDARKAVPKLIELLKNPDHILRRGAATALAGIGPSAKDAVPSLKAVLDDKDENVRWRAIQALGQIGEDAKSSIDLLSGVLDSENVDIRQYSAEALENISNFLYNAKDTDAISQLKKADQALLKSNDPAVRKHIPGVEKNINYLESLWWLNIVRWIVGHPLASLLIAVYPLLLLFCLLSLWLRPRWLLQINDVLSESLQISLPGWLGGNNFSLRHALLVGFFRYHPRVLDAWVVKHIQSARKMFTEKETVEAREMHIPVPVNFNKKIVADLKPDHLRDTFDKGFSLLLVWGEGGVGKTSLACLLAKWAMSEDKNQRLCPERFMLPVLIEQNLEVLTKDNNEPLLKAIADQLRILIEEDKPLSPEMLKRLLAHGRILVIIDGFSEMSETSRTNILLSITDIPANAVVITSRTAEVLNNLPRSTIEPMRIGAKNLISFMEAYLTQCGKRHLFDDDDFVSAYRSLSVIVGDGEITVLLAKLYVEQMISVQEQATEILLPSNMPDLMLNYINIIYRSPATDDPDIQTIHKAIEAIAWECLKTTFKPMPAPREDVLAALGGQESGLRLVTYIEKRMKLIQTVEPGRNEYRFVLDPLSEYLAALHVVKLCGGRDEKWRELLGLADKKQGAPELIKGFLLALRDCCMTKGPKLSAPTFVADELARRVGFDPNERKSLRTKRKIRQYTLDLRSADPEDRAEAAVALSKMKMERGVEVAIPALISALKDEDYKVAGNAAEALGDIGPAAETAVPALVELLSAEDYRLRSIAVEALGRIGPRAKASCPALVELLKNPKNEQSQDIRSKILNALKKIEIEAANLSVEFKEGDKDLSTS
jgi:HEAT repeat protein